jgi:hypothetical protein
MAWAVFDRVYNNELIGEIFTYEGAAQDFLLEYADEEDFANLYVDEVCNRHVSPEAESVCPCNYYDPRDI